MKVTQAFEILNAVTKEVLGEEEVTTIDASNLVSIGTKFDNLDLMDKYVKKLINHIGRVVFVDRIYQGQAPSVFMDGTEFGSILEKIRVDLPEARENRTWALENGLDYGDHTFYAPSVHAKFFNDMVTHEIRMSYAYLQVKQSFSSATQLTAFFTLIETQIKNSMTVKNEALVMTTIGNMMAGTIHKSFGDTSDLSGKTSVKAINLLYEYNQYKKATDPAVTAANMIYSPEFIRYAAFRIKTISDRLTRASTLFNVGGTTKFTPKELQRIILHADFGAAADVFLQSETFHNELTKLPNADRVSFWQGSGTNFSFESTSDIHYNILNPDGDNTTVEVAASGILGCIFDRDALGVTNVNERVRMVDTPNAEFYTNFYKRDARYFNDYDENFVVFYGA